MTGLYHCRLCGRNFRKGDILLKHIIGECQIPTNKLEYWENIVKLAFEVTIKDIHNGGLPPSDHLTIEEIRALFILKSVDFITDDGLPDSEEMKFLLAKNAPDSIIALMAYAKVIKQNPNGTFSIEKQKERST